MDILLEINARKPLYLQLRDALRQQIRNGTPTYGARLPSARELADQLHVSRNTVAQAYSLLEEDGLVRIQPGQGAFVQVHAQARGQRTRAVDWQQCLTPEAKRAVDLRVGKRVELGNRQIISFASLAPDHRLFEVELFRKGLNDMLAQEGGYLLGYGYARGYEPLRQGLSAYLAGKAVDMDGKILLIVNGFRQGLTVTARTLCQPGDAVLVETPCYNGALGVFQSMGALVHQVESDAQGILPEALAAAVCKHRPKFLYLVPTYHNPTGRSMSAARRTAVLELAAQYALPVIEDGFNEELRYRGEAHSSLMAMDACSTVIHIGSFSKVLFPGLRVGWLVAPREMEEALLAVKYHEDIHTSLLPQAGLYAFLQRGGLDKHLHGVRRVYGQRLTAMLDGLKAHMTPYADWEAPQGGFSVWLTLKERMLARPLLERAKEKGVLFAPGDVFYTKQGGGERCLRLGFSRLTETEIQEGLALLATACQEYQNE